MTEESNKTQYWIGAIFLPVVVVALTFVVARVVPGRESDWLGGRFLLVALIGLSIALLGAVGLTIMSVRKGERWSGLAIVSCLIYLGLFLKAIL